MNLWGYSQDQKWHRPHDINIPELDAIDPVITFGDTFGNCQVYQTEKNYIFQIVIDNFEQTFVACDFPSMLQLLDQVQLIILSNAKINEFYSDD